MILTKQFNPQLQQRIQMPKELRTGWKKKWLFKHTKKIRL